MAKTVSKVTGDGKYQKTVLPNGIRVLTETMPAVRSISIGVWVDCGSRNESLEEAGLSHFIEHMVFKGTRRRSAKQIADSLESVGGSLNAFTSREQTCFTARVLDEYLIDAIDVLADLTCHATFSKVNMDRERQVICEEIKESLDNPADYIHDLFAHAFWGGTHSLGLPIMGTRQSIMKMPRGRMLEYRERNYRAGSVVVAAAGAISHAKLVKLVTQHFSFEPGLVPEPVKAVRMFDSRISIREDDNSQTHFCLGFSGLPYGDKRRMAVVALNTYLGGGMSSVLFQKIREDRGLAYSVYSYHDFYRDAGVFATYLGTDKTHLEQAYAVIIAECRKMKRKKLPLSVLEKVKAQIKGHMSLGLESTSSHMNRIARLEIMLGKFFTLRESLRDVDKVTSRDILEVANEIFDERSMAIAVLGPVSKGLFTHAA